MNNFSVKLSSYLSKSLITNRIQEHRSLNHLVLLILLARHLVRFNGIKVININVQDSVIFISLPVVELLIVIMGEVGESCSLDNVVIIDSWSIFNMIIASGTITKYVFITKLDLYISCLCYLRKNFFLLMSSLSLSLSGVISNVSSSVDMNPVMWPSIQLDNAATRLPAVMFKQLWSTLYYITIRVEKMTVKSGVVDIVSPNISIRFYVDNISSGRHWNILL